MACSDSDYTYLRELVLSQSANLIDPSRNALFETRLSPVIQLAGAANIEDLVTILRMDRPAHLHRAVAEAMTINETSFLRDLKPFEALRHTILPRLIDQRRDQQTLRIWSAACSTGQETYSLAMVLLEHFPQLADWDIQILGSDISRQVIDYAGRARYRRLEVNRGLPARFLLKYFTRIGEEWELKENVRSLCQFQCINLCAPLPILPAFDFIMLRNVLLYFPQQDRSCVFSDMHRHLAPHGFLFLGNAEQAEDSTDLFRAEFAHETYFYRPVSTGPATSPK